MYQVVQFQTNFFLTLFPIPKTGRTSQVDDKQQSGMIQKLIIKEFCYKREGTVIYVRAEGPNLFPK